MSGAPTNWISQVSAFEKEERKWLRCARRAANSESISLLGTNQSDTRQFTVAILSTILIGLVVGAIAKLLMPGKDPGGFIVTILLGIAGAFIATYLGQALGWYKAGQPAGWIMSIIGAMILLLLYRLLFKRKQ